MDSDKLHLDRPALCMLCYKSEDDHTGQEMILEDQVQRDKGPGDGVPGTVPHNTENSQSSAHSDLLGCKKVSKIVMTPVSATGHVAVDTSKLANEVSPIKTYTLYLS